MGRCLCLLLIGPLGCLHRKSRPATTGFGPCADLLEETWEIFRVDLARMAITFDYKEFEENFHSFIK